LLYLGRLRYYKSVDTAIRALPLLVDSYPDIQFSIAGSGPAKSDLQLLAREIGVLDRVRFHGYVSEQEKISLLQEAHVVVNPSLKEGWGLTVLEANACGTPVVGADVPGLRDSICHDITGYLVPHGDHTSLAMAVDRLLGDSNKRQIMGANARDWGLKFDWDASAIKCMTILEQVVNGNK
jgi:glycosyltransferase involved in cell wall biosynthesis